jgi:demethylmenaquinone methyltransferase/2-methoxy-6-polyprenyl-1,4-benzoquinol methylase
MQDPEFVKQAFTDIADRYVVTNHVLSGGIDILWRKGVAKQVAVLKPERVLDLATGSGDLAMEILKKVPDTHVTCGDFCEPMLAEAAKRGLKDLVVADGMDLPFEDASYDVVTIGFGLRNMADWPLGVREMARVLKPGGTLIVLEFALPKGALRR